MFWQASNYSQPSPIEQILEKENYTLEELLDEDDLIQETKSLNGRLIEYLKQPETVSKLLAYVVEPYEKALPKTASQPSPEAKRAFKFPYVACEVFCCEAESIFSTLLEDEQLLAKLFSILDLPRPLDCVLAGYFSRVVHCLVMRKWGENNEQSAKIIQFLQAHPEVLDKMINHVETTSVAEVLLRFLGADENSAGFLSPGRLSWMASTPVMDHLLEQLGPSATADSQHNAAYILSGIARSHFTPLAHALAAPQFLSRLFEFAFAPNVSMLALDVCIALLEPKEAAAEQLSSQLGQVPSDLPSLGPQSELDAKMRAAAVQEMVKHLGRLKDILEGSGAAGKKMLTPFGVLAPPLGTARLKAVEVVSALLLTCNPVAEAALIESGLLKTCLSLFLQFPFNNLLHHLVTSIICFVLENVSTEVLDHLLGDCQLVQWLVEAPEQVTPQQSGDSAAGKPIRAGYLGHLTHIANRLAEAATMRDAVAAALGATPAWGPWVEDTLRGRNDMENVLTWSCGLPSKREAPSVPSVDELDAESHSFQDLGESRTGQAGANSRYSSFNDDFDENDDDDLFPSRSRLNGWDTWEAGQAQDEVAYTWGSPQQDVDPQEASAQSPPDGGSEAAGLNSSSHSSKDFIHTNDTTAAFRNLRLEQGISLAGDDSSSSSSSDDDELPLRRIPLSVGLEDDAVVVNSDSDEDVDMDDDTVMVAAAARVQPSDAGFSDFADFGGFQPSDDAPISFGRGKHGAAAAASGGAAGKAEDETPQNGFADPTDAGWIPSRTSSGHMSSPAPETAEHWNAFGGDTLPPTPSHLENAERSRQHSENGVDPRQQAPSAQSAEPEMQEFSSFNFWRQPVHLQHLEEGKSGEAGQANGKQAGAR